MATSSTSFDTFNAPIEDCLEETLSGATSEATPGDDSTEEKIKKAVSSQPTFLHPHKVRTPEFRKYTVDRHAIPDPTNSIEDAKIWVQTVIKERVGSLFLSTKGLMGHLTALQYELNRVNRSKL